MIIAIVISTFTISAESISIDEAHFPDAVFREYVSEHFDTKNKDGILSDEEIKEVVKIEYLPASVSSIEGIKYFSYLESLSISNTKVETVDVSENSVLKSLYVVGRSIKEVDTGGLQSLDQFWSDDTSITSIDLQSNTALTEVHIRDLDELISLKLPKNGLAHLTLESAENLDELDLSDTKDLRSLVIMNTGIKVLNIRQSVSLNTLYIEDTPIAELDLSDLTELVSIDITNADINKIDISKMSKLQYLILNDTLVDGLDLKNNPALRYLDTSGSPLAYLNIYSDIRPIYTKDVTLNLEVKGASFMITDYLKDIDLSKVVDLKGASISGNEFKDYVPGVDITYRYAVKSDSYIDVTLDLVINKIDPTIILKNGQKVYDGLAFVPELEIDEGIKYTLSYQYENGSDLDEAPINAGNYKLVVSTSEDDFHNRLTKKIAFSIKKADPEIYIPGRLTYKFGETAPEIKALSRSPEVISYEYFTLDQDLNWQYVDDRPKDAGIYKVIASVSESNNYIASSTSRIFMILQSDPDTKMVSVIADKVYDGMKVDDPEVDHGDSQGKTFIKWYKKSDDRWLKVDEAKDVGEYAVVLFVLSDGNHYGDIEYDTFKITKAENHWLKPLTYDDGRPDAEAAFGEVSYVYSLKEEGPYTDEKPSSSIFYIKAIVIDTENYSGLEMIIEVNERTSISEDITPPSIKPDTDKELPRSDEECAVTFGKDYIYSKEYGACIIRYLIPDTKTK